MGVPVAKDRGEGIIEYLAIILLLILVIVLFISIFRFGKKDYQNLALVMAGRERKAFEVLKPCPLCATMLRKGQTVKSKVIEIATSSSGDKFAANRMGVKETIAHVFGCPYCWPYSSEHRRVCPFCKAELGQDDYVIARYFEKAQGRNHLHVLGCTRCRKK